MTRAGAHIRMRDRVQEAVNEAWEQWKRLQTVGCSYTCVEHVAEALRNRQLCFAHAIYLEAIAFALESGVGSRGSSMVVDSLGTRIHDKLGEEWRMVSEEPAFREKVLETSAEVGDTARDYPNVNNRWVERRPIPQADAWFETAWASFRSGEVFD